MTAYLGENPDDSAYMEIALEVLCSLIESGVAVGTKQEKVNIAFDYADLMIAEGQKRQEEGEEDVGERGDAAAGDG